LERSMSLSTVENLTLDLVRETQAVQMLLALT
jgi:hypothetical protein